jgi:hypothetical protein
MIYYTVFGNRQNAELISRELYRLSIGEKIEQGYTQHLLSIYEHPEGSLFFALKIDEEVKIPMIVNPNPNPDLLINYYKSLNEMTEQEEEEIRAKVITGDTITLGDIIPAKTRERFKTYEQMQADGWFVESSEV